MQSDQSVIELLDSSSEEEESHVEKKPTSCSTRRTLLPFMVRRKSSRKHVPTKFLGFSEVPDLTEHSRIKKLEIVTINSDSSDEDEEDAAFLDKKPPSYKHEEGSSSPTLDILYNAAGDKRKKSREGNMPKRLGFSESSSEKELEEDFTDAPATRSSKVLLERPKNSDDPDLFPDDRSTNEANPSKCSSNDDINHCEKGRQLFAMPLGVRRKSPPNKQNSSDHCRIKKIRRLTIESDSSDEDEDEAEDEDEDEAHDEFSEKIFGKSLQDEHSDKTSSKGISRTSLRQHRKSSRKSCVPNWFGRFESPGDENFDESKGEDLCDAAAKSTQPTRKLQNYDDADLFSNDSDCSKNEYDFARFNGNIVTPMVYTRDKAPQTDLPSCTPVGCGDDTFESPPSQPSDRTTHSGTRVSREWGHSKPTSGWGSNLSQSSGGWGQLIEETSEIETPRNLASSLYRSPPSIRAKRKLPEDILGDNTPIQCYELCTDQFILKHLFGSRNVIRLNVKKKDGPVEKEVDVNGNKGKLFQLVATKHEEGNFEKAIPTVEYIKAYYVKGSHDFVQKRLEGFAHFSELWNKPGKLAARMELLVSPACSIPFGKEKRACLYRKDVEEFEVLSLDDFPENKTMGCGFIPKDMLVSLLGGGRLADQANAIQVRIVSPKHGIFKGMLLRKDNIKKIQLPLSMMKVRSAQTPNTTHDGKEAYLLVNTISPSERNENLERHINPHISQKPTKTASNKLKGIPPQVSRLLLQNGVDQDVLDEYDKSEAKTFETCGHTSLYGVCDNTNNGLPEGSVFIPGLYLQNRMVLITRIPCTEETDLSIVPVVTAKPSKMADKIWKELCNLSFGIIIFASPNDPNMKSLPELINNSDLDGDQFVVIWEENILNCLKNKNMEPGREIHCLATTYSSGDSVEVRWKNGKYYPAKIRKVCLCEGQETYDVHFVDGDTLNAVTLEKIRKSDQPRDKTEDNMTTVTVVAHRGEGKKLEVEVEEKIGGIVKKKKWRNVGQFKNVYEKELAKYAIKNKLLQKTGWEFSERFAEIVSIQNIEYTPERQGAPERLNATVLLNCGLSDEVVDVTDIRVDLLSKYYEERNESMPPIINDLIKEAQKEWLSALQERLVDVDLFSNISNLRTRLSNEYKNKKGIHCAADVQAFARACKLTNDLEKHGGQVPLPEHLREIVVGNCYRLNYLIKDV